jgi:hypothetical protein
MSEGSIDVSATIHNTPEAVMNYIANVRNRPFYLASLKAVSDIREAPGQVGTRWKWTWSALGLEFEGTGTCLAYEAGKLYSFRTEGGISSTWTYKAEPEGAGTKLSIRVEFQVPERARSVIPIGAAAESMKKTEAERVVQNLKHILDR